MKRGNYSQRSRAPAAFIGGWDDTCRGCYNTGALDTSSGVFTVPINGSGKYSIKGSIYITNNDRNYPFIYSDSYFGFFLNRTSDGSVAFASIYDKTRFTTTGDTSSAITVAVLRDMYLEEGEALAFSGYFFSIFDNDSRKQFFVVREGIYSTFEVHRFA